MSLLTIPFSTEGLDSNTGAFDTVECWLCDYTARRMKSGGIFELHADNAAKIPLPSFQPLELQ